MSFGDYLQGSIELIAVAGAMAYAAVALTSGPDGLPGLAVAGWGIGLGFTSAISLFPFLFLLFPNGRLPSRRWRPLAWAIVAAGGLMLVAAALVPGTTVEGVANPIGVGGWLGGIFDRVIDPGTGMLFVAIALSALSLLPRFRRAQGVERQQLKWLAYAAVLVGAFIIGDAVGLQTSGLVDLLLETLTMIGVYVGIGIAVLRYRLYEIDRLINRTLVYGTLTALLGLIYAVAVFGWGTC